MKEHLQEAPPSTLRQGAVDHGNGRVTFALYAPGLRSAHLIGSLNGGDYAADPMEQTGDGLWQAEKSLPPGVYTYQYLIDGHLVVCDPYARAVEWVAPGAVPHALLSVGGSAYAWRHSGWRRPELRDLVLYELNIRDFSPEGTFKGVLDRLDHLSNLGINAIELMPVFTAEGGGEGWGYDPDYFFAVNSAFGADDELRALIDAAHGRGIAVILDIVLAHTGKRHPFTKLSSFGESPWYGPGLGEPNRFGFPSLDYRKKAAKEFARDVITYWLQEFRFDGLRFDYLLGIGAAGDDGIPFLARCGREARPDAWLIAEYSPEAPALVVESGFDAAWHVIARYALVALLRQGRLDEHDWNDFAKVTSSFDPRAAGYDTVYRAINFLESHDEERIIYDTFVVGLSEEEAFRKAALGASVIMTLPGEPMLYNGQEWGEGTRKTLRRNPLHWEALDGERGRRLFEHIRLLCRLRREFPALSSLNYAVAARRPEQKVLIFRRWDDEREADALVAVNFSPVEQLVIIPFPRRGVWWEALYGEALDISGKQEAFLEPSSAKIFLWAAQSEGPHLSAIIP